MTTPSRPGNPEALKAARAAQSAQKQDAVLNALQEMLRNGDPISIARVARCAGVGRDLIYKHAALRERVEASMAAQQVSEAKAQPTPKGTSAASAGLKSDLALAQQELRRLRAENQQLRTDRRLDLGAALEARDQENLASLLAERAREVERLTVEVNRLQRQNRALAAERDEIADDLAAERQAALLETRPEENVSPIRRTRTPQESGLLSKLTGADRR